MHFLSDLLVYLYNIICTEFKYGKESASLFFVNVFMDIMYVITVWTEN